MSAANLIAFAFAYIEERIAGIKAKNAQDPSTKGKMSSINVTIGGGSNLHGTAFKPFHGYLATVGLREIYHFAFPMIGKMVCSLSQITNKKAVSTLPTPAPKILQALPAAGVPEAPLKSAPDSRATRTRKERVHHGGASANYYVTIDVGGFPFLPMYSLTGHLFSSYGVDPDPEPPRSSGTGNHPEGELVSNQTMSYARCVARIFLFLSRKQEERGSVFEEGTNEGAEIRGAGEEEGSEEEKMPQSYALWEGGPVVDASTTDGEIERIFQEAMIRALEGVNWDDDEEPEGGGRLESVDGSPEEVLEGGAEAKQLPAPISEEPPTSQTFALWEGGPVVDKTISDKEAERLFQDAMLKAVESVDWDDEEDDNGPPASAPNAVLATPTSPGSVEDAVAPVGRPLSYLEIHGRSKLRFMENYDDWSYKEGDECCYSPSFVNGYAGKSPTHTLLPPASQQLAAECRARESEVITDLYWRMSHWWEKENRMTVHKAARIRSALYAEYWEGYDPYMS